MIYNYYRALEIAWNEFDEAINKGLHSSKAKPFTAELNFRLVSLIHLAMDCWERVRNSELPIDKDDADYIDAFWRVSNLIKHNEDFLLLHGHIRAFTLPFRLPMRFGKPSLFWGDIPAQLGEIEGKNRLRLVACYNSHLSHKPLGDTSRKMVEIIMKYMKLL